MRIFVCEYITAGGGREKDLPGELTQEGDLMLNALLDDLLQAGYTDLVCTREELLSPLPYDIDIRQPGDDIHDTWQSLLLECDAAWIIAPETSGALYQLVQMAEKCNCRVIGCTSRFVSMATSKRQTADWLKAHRLPTATVYENPRDLPDNNNGWVIKPDDGAGGDGVYFFKDLQDLRDYWPRLAGQHYLVQPYIPGTAASISLLTHAGRAVLLGCNEQQFLFNQEGRGELHAVIVNGLYNCHESLSTIASGLAAAMAGETAIIGADLVINSHGVTVIEINPRLTTSYAGLRKSLQVNPAGLLLSLMQGGDMPDEKQFRYHPVRINL